MIGKNYLFGKTSKNNLMRVTQVLIVRESAFHFCWNHPDQFYHLLMLKIFQKHNFKSYSKNQKQWTWKNILRAQMCMDLLQEVRYQTMVLVTTLSFYRQILLSLIVQLDHNKIRLRNLTNPQIKMFKRILNN
jgi:hypothetical protein